MDLKCVLISDFERVCRICMKFNKTFISINSYKIVEMIMACASVQIWENDDLPNQICNECFLQLQNTVNFKQLCENSDNAFRQIIEQNKSRDNQNELDNLKNEEFDSSSFPVCIKKENEVENSKEDSSLPYNIKTVYKYEEESGGFENTNDENYSENEDAKEEIDCENEDEKSEWKCETCSRLFKKVDVLGVHMKKIHNAEGIKCGKCSLICYHPLHLRAHEKSHNRCRICNLTFLTQTKLSQHKLTHENDYVPEVFCELCPTKFSNKHSLYKHIRFIHKIEKIRQRPKCDKCDETFKTKRILLKHMRKMHKKDKIKYKDQIVNCEICGKSFKRCYLRKHMLTHDERDNVACEFCEKLFKSQLTLRNHIRNYHKNSGPVCRYLCNQCGLKLRSKYHLNSHLLTHTKERPFACDKCEKTYRTSFRLKEHISRVHLNQRNFVCTFCSLAFYDKKILLAHVRRHTGEKPFKCKMCDKRFIQEVALKVHMKVHTNSV